MEIEQGQSLETQLYSRQFKDNSFSINDEKIKQVIDYLNVMEPYQNADKCRDQLLLIQQLIKFYATPILICFENYYRELIKRNDLIQKNEEQIKIIASLVKSQTNQAKLQQLKFFSFIGLSQKKFILNKSTQQKDFLKYISKLSGWLFQMQKRNQKGKGSNQKEFSETLNQLMCDILQSDCGRPLNILQENYQNYFKYKAMNMFNQISAQQQPIQSATSKQNAQSSMQTYQNQQVNKQNVPLCCRSFFYKNQVIPQPQSLRIQYKHYTFPYKPQSINILKKTFCGFLNAQGGTIFVGIAQNNQTKKRTIAGGVYDQNVKEDILKVFRRVAESIEPDIVTHKLYNVSFVPIKKNSSPYSYISGNYVIKISIRYGVRDDIYLYKNQEGQEFYSFRTQNQVIHRKGREVLIALKERVKNPLPVPQPLHNGACSIPQIGKPIHYGENVNSRSNYSHPQEKKKIEYRQKQKTKTSKRQYRLVSQVWCYLINGINEQQLRGHLRKFDIDLNSLKTQKKPNSTFIKINSSQTNEKFLAKKYNLSDLDSKIKIIEITNQLKIQGDSESNLDWVKDIIANKKIYFENDRGGPSFKFNNASDSVQVYLVLNQFGVNSEFM